jgi:hypothetical protein
MVLLWLHVIRCIVRQLWPGKWSQCKIFSDPFYPEPDQRSNEISPWEVLNSDFCRRYRYSTRYRTNVALAVAETSPRQATPVAEAAR